MKLAAYLDEIDPDPIKACRCAADLGITHVCLSRVWTNDVSKLTDESCATLSKELTNNGLNVIAICSNLGLVAVNRLHDYYELAQRTALICKYFGAMFCRFFPGRQRHNLTRDVAVAAWFDHIDIICAAASITPIIELEPESSIFDIRDAVKFIIPRTNLYWLYDPASLISQKKQDPLQYWQLLNRRCAAINLRDYNTDTGVYCPVGHGHCNWHHFGIKNFDGWCFLEPSLGRHYGGHHTLLDTFRQAFVCATSFITTGSAVLDM